MKYKTTKKSIMEGNTVLKIGYCNLQTLLTYENPFAYSTRAEGWACDYYNAGEAVISTGYAPCGKPVPYDIQRKYEEKARRVMDNKWAWKQKKSYLWKLLQKFVEEVTK